MSKTLVWILGRGGFLGSALADHYTAQGDSIYPATPINWNNSQSRITDYIHNFDGYIQNPWEGNRRIIWAAGSSGVGTTASSIDLEIESFQDFISTFENYRSEPHLTFYLCSSAGGVYARSQNPPFCSTTAPNPQSRYGELKLAMEKMAVDQIASHLPTTIGRISNLYGPWRGSRQGLINRLCRAAVERSPLNLFVPMETIRDYLYASDAAQLIAQSEPPENGGWKLEVVGSGVGTTIAQVISTIGSVAHRKVPISIGADSIALEQPNDLRLVPSWHVNNPGFTPIDLATGCHRVLTHMTTRPRVLTVL
jgi:UDP-glucose 4-epimerase